MILELAFVNLQKSIPVAFCTAVVLPDGLEPVALFELVPVPGADLPAPFPLTGLVDPPWLFDGELPPDPVEALLCGEELAGF